MDTLPQAVLQQRRERVARAWSLQNELVLLGAGEPVPIPGGADQVFPFRAHAEYHYLTDLDEPGGVLAFDPHDGWRLFTPDVTERERLWEGREHSPGESLTQLGPWLAVRRGRPLAMLGCPLAGTPFDAKRTVELREQMSHARRPKDAAEIERLRRAAAATAAGFAAARAALAPGRSEREIQIVMEAEFFRAGGDRTAFDTIVASGPNSAVLHFSPTARRLAEGELVLVDAGAEVRRYAADVTRTFPAAGSFSPLQRALFDVVLRTQRNAVARCRAGVETRDLHLAAHRDVAEGLLGVGLLRGSADELVEREATTLFFPHGIGHLVGLGVRDASGTLPGRKPSDRPVLSTLRCDLPLEAGYVITIEPGVYFVRALLTDPQRRERFRDAVDWDMVDRNLDFGGIRIEDDVLVTSGEPDVLTASIPL